MRTIKPGQTVTCNGEIGIVIEQVSTGSNKEMVAVMFIGAPCVAAVPPEALTIITVTSVDAVIAGTNKTVTATLTKEK